jgi:hypothetical protein
MGHSNSKDGELENLEVAGICWRSKLLQDHTQSYTAEYQLPKQEIGPSVQHPISNNTLIKNPINRNPSRTLELHPSETDADRDLRATARVTQADHAPRPLQIDAARSNQHLFSENDNPRKRDETHERRHVGGRSCWLRSVPDLRSAEKRDQTRQETVSSGRIVTPQDPARKNDSRRASIHREAYTRARLNYRLKLAQWIINSSSINITAFIYIYKEYEFSKTIPTPPVQPNFDRRRYLRLKK